MQIPTSTEGDTQAKAELLKQQSILRLPEVIQRTGLGRASIYRMMEAGTFPSSVKLSERATGWVSTEIQEWIEQRIAASRNDEGSNNG